MALERVRIDHRLVHGQVVEGWIKPLGIRRVAVISDTYAQGEVQKALIALSVPPVVSVAVLSAAESVSWLKEDGRTGPDTLVLAPSPAEILNLLENGVSLAAVNVAGLHSPKSDVRISAAISLSRADLQALRKIAARGVRLFAQALPADAPQELNALIADGAAGPA